MLSVSRIAGYFEGRYYDQYWLLIGAVLLTHSNQYWLLSRPCALAPIAVYRGVAPSPAGGSSDLRKKIVLRGATRFHDPTHTYYA